MPSQVGISRCQFCTEIRRSRTGSLESPVLNLIEHDVAGPTILHRNCGIPLTWVRSRRIGTREQIALMHTAHELAPRRNQARNTVGSNAGRSAMPTEKNLKSDTGDSDQADRWNAVMPPPGARSERHQAGSDVLRDERVDRMVPLTRSLTRVYARQAITPTASDSSVPNHGALCSNGGYTCQWVR